MPLASIRPGELEFLVNLVLCTARLDAVFLSRFGGKSTSDIASVPSEAFDRNLNSWADVLEASGTATAGEFGVWLDELTGEDCFVDPEPSPGEAPAVGVMYGPIYSLDPWPITLSKILCEVRDSVQEQRVVDLAQAVARREGFRVEITAAHRRPGGEDINSEAVDPQDYPYARSAPNRWSVAEWVEKRFGAYYPSLEVKVWDPQKKVRSDITLGSLRRRWKDTGLDPAE